MPEDLADQFGKLEVKHAGGRPPSKLRLPKMDYSASMKLLKEFQSEELVKMLEECGGDLGTFLASFDNRLGKKEIVLTKVLFILQQDENPEHLKRWDRLLQSNKMARMAMLEREHVSNLQQMPKPNKKTPLRDWITYGNFWTGDFKEGNKVRAQQAAKSASGGSGGKGKTDPNAGVLAAIQEMVEGMSNSRNSEDEQQS